MGRAQVAEARRQSETGSLLPVTFQFPGRLAPLARHVAVTGPFNGWDPQVHRLTLNGDGDWVITVYLPPGRVVYCFAVDGTAWLDPADQGRISNGWGSEYSIRYVGDGTETLPYNCRRTSVKRLAGTS
jgi:AMP-activated protein kinase-like protein